MNLDFATILVLLTLGSGLIWLIDAMFLSSRRDKSPEDRAEPKIVEYARSFFPIFLVVLLLRSFLIEPFRIPSGSMMPTLLTGDFILVNKYTYGIRLPALNTKVIELNTPQRGDVVVFRYPVDPSIPFIKRIVGIPGDEIIYQNKILYINGEPMNQEYQGIYEDEGAGYMMNGAKILSEDLGTLKHSILIREGASTVNGKTIIPEGKYFALGDNRDNSKDSRYWGFIPDENIIGKAFMIWMNWDWESDGVIDVDRIGTSID